jgi:hypothetical protein
MFNATFNNISAILWQSFLWWKPPTNLPQITDKLDHKVVLSVADKGGNQKREIIKLPSPFSIFIKKFSFNVAKIVCQNVNINYTTFFILFKILYTNIFYL